MPLQNARYRTVSTLTNEDVADLTTHSEAIQTLADNVATVSDTFSIAIDAANWIPAPKLSSITRFLAYYAKEVQISKDISTPEPKLVMIAPHMTQIDEKIDIPNQIESILNTDFVIQRSGVRLLSYTKPYEKAEATGSFWMTKMYFVAEYDIPSVPIQLDIQVIG
jgi:hypothetical protein